MCVMFRSFLEKNKCEFYTHFQNEDRKKVEFGSCHLSTLQVFENSDETNN